MPEAYGVVAGYYVYVALYGMVDVEPFPEWEYDLHFEDVSLEEARTMLLEWNKDAEVMAVAFTKLKFPDRYVTIESFLDVPVGAPICRFTCFNCGLEELWSRLPPGNRCLCEECNTVRHPSQQENLA